VLVFCLGATTPVSAAELGKGVFLVATENLTHSSFRETVILLTHSSARGSTGIAINRPSQISLHEAFPDIRQFKQLNDELYLGGPVLSNRVFVLMMTERPHAGMHEVGKNLFFTSGLNAVIHGLDKLKPGEHTRAYAGYTGWAAGQLEAEIARGDWRVVAYDPRIVFDNELKSVWSRLYERFSGRWI
jgi:putative transcriptional regulator